MDYVKQVKNLKQVLNFSYFEYLRLKLKTWFSVLHTLNISS